MAAQQIRTLTRPWHRPVAAAHEHPQQVPPRSHVCTRMHFITLFSFVCVMKGCSWNNAKPTCRVQQNLLHTLMTAERHRVEASLQRLPDERRN
eukprot:1124556-Amphidinium_carterae.1